MARIEKNIITTGLRGMLGNGIVFRRIGNKTFASAPPKPSQKPRSEKQLARQELFKEAAFYARTQKLNPVVWEVYTAIARQRNSNPWAIAVSDFMTGLALLKPS
jgi:hypothetical protein